MTEQNPPYTTQQPIWRIWMSVAIGVIIAILLSLWSIYGMKSYGMVLFLFIPFLMGAIPVIIYGSKYSITITYALLLGIRTLVIYLVGLIIFAFEGLICITMAIPILLLLVITGSLIGYVIVKKAPDRSSMTIVLLIFAFPTLSFLGKDHQPSLTSVVTQIEIEADLPTVWKNVIEFSPLEEPTEFIFKTGIAYPLDASIEGSGVGAIRYCNFTTGSFVEPITVWEEPHLLKFDVLEQPEPMKELSFWDIDAPHLHDYFVSKQGQFKLTKLPNGNTLLEGTTWYYHNIRPNMYWQWWSDTIIHQIHNRVLKHIKKQAETENR